MLRPQHVQVQHVQAVSVPPRHASGRGVAQSGGLQRVVGRAGPSAAPGPACTARPRNVTQIILARTIANLWRAKLTGGSAVQRMQAGMGGHKRRAESSKGGKGGGPRGGCATAQRATAEGAESVCWATIVVVMAEHTGVGGEQPKPLPALVGPTWSQNGGAGRCMGTRPQQAGVSQHVVRAFLGMT